MKPGEKISEMRRDRMHGGIIVENTTVIMIANAVVWIGIGLYLFFLSTRQNALERRLRRMEDANDGHGN